MSLTIQAIYENGVFRPTETINLPDPCRVEVDVRPMPEQTEIPTLDDVYAILGRRHSSGEHDLAERHNEPSRAGYGGVEPVATRIIRRGSMGRWKPPCIAPRLAWIRSRDTAWRTSNTTSK